MFAFHGLYSKNTYKTCGKKIRSVIVLEFLNNQMDDHLPLALLELVVALSNMIGIIMLRLVHLIGMIQI